MKVAFTSARSLLPATDQIWLPSAPYVHRCSCFSTTNVGPTPHLSTVSSSSDPVGKRKTGPAPQIQPLAVGALGEKNKLCTTSLIPDCFPAPGAISFCETIGRIVREITFQVLFNSIGITGWTLSSHLLPSSAGPMFVS